MNVCLIIDDYLPDSIKVGAKMMHELALEMMAAGHQVTIITPQVDLSAHYKMDHLDGVTVCRFRSGPIKNVGRVKRAINETLLSWRVERIVIHAVLIFVLVMTGFALYTFFYGADQVLGIKTQTIQDIYGFLI